MERLTTAYERILVAGSAEMQYVANASDLEVESRLRAYEDAEEEGRLFVMRLLRLNFLNGIVTSADLSSRMSQRNRSSMQMNGLTGMPLICTRTKKKHERKQSSCSARGTV